MSRPAIVVALDDHLARDLAAGGAFVPGCDLAITEECELVVRGVGGSMQLNARVVFVDPSGRGAGLEIVGFQPGLRARLAEIAIPPVFAQGSETELDPNSTLALAPEEAAAEITDEADDAREEAELARKAPTLHERMRGLTLVQQLKVAHTGDQQERVVLERLYGKTVWEALLRNPKITGPEVARIARMGALPRVLIEIIVGNGAWLQVPEVRRALLGHPRLAAEHIPRVLRLLPKHELKLAMSQTAYPLAVREAARRMLGG